MVGFINQTRHVMFHGATNAVKAQLDGMCLKIRDHMIIQAQELHARIARDYLAVLVGSDASSIKGLPRAERLLRGGVLSLLGKSDSHFEQLISRLTPEGVPMPEAIPGVLARTGSSVPRKTPEAQILGDLRTSEIPTVSGYRTTPENGPTLWSVPAMKATTEGSNPFTAMDVRPSIELPATHTPPLGYGSVSHSLANRDISVNDDFGLFPSEGRRSTVADSQEPDTYHDADHDVAMDNGDIEAQLQAEIARSACNVSFDSDASSWMGIKSEPS